MLLNITITIILVLLNGFFVAAEFALVKVRISQLELRIRSGSKLAEMAKHLVEHIDSYLSACQLGITLASLALGWIGESVVAEIIKSAMLFLGFHLTPAVTHSIALPIAFITITSLHIVFGEQAPKSLAIQKSESVALGVSFLLRIFYLTFKPVIWLLNSMAIWVIRLLGIEPNFSEAGTHSSEEIRYLLKESSESGMINITEHELIENVFEFTDTPVKQVMVPRNKIIAASLDTPNEDLMKRFLDEGYSRIPIYSNSIDNIIGVVYAKDIIHMMRNQKLIILHDIIRKPFFVSEDQKINILLRDMQKKRAHLAVVIDEFGGTAGIVTLEDIIEELVGEIQDEYDEETPVVEIISDNEFCVKAMAPIDDINDSLPFPLPESEDYETIGGLITARLGRIPEKTEEFEIDNYMVRIIESSDRSIEKVRLTVIRPSEEL